MKKSDLKDGMIVKFRGFNDLGVVLLDKVYSKFDMDDLFNFISLNSYDDDLILNEDEDTYGYTIDEIYECKVENILMVVQCNNYDSLRLIWKRVKVDWSKVEFGTEVYVRDCDNEEWEKAKFLEYCSDIEHPFKVYIDADSSISWRQCKLKENKPRYNARIFFEKPKNDFPD